MFVAFYVLAFATATPYYVERHLREGVFLRHNKFVTAGMV